ncbi:hypothetical protein MSG_04197 [Mycobacterium shigaense]|uniref:Uncharacterized protein n=1 Tax=Mycobacterium shigaense TaxID=722731 RepID=A0A1Z4EMZ1_9MYCO|nr:hypothetical protein MSG_04197 [Mycobacterium shigaense]
MTETVTYRCSRPKGIGTNDVMNNAPTQRFVHAADAPDNTRINIGNF